jgi:hypothetical protein
LLTDDRSRLAAALLLALSLGAGTAGAQTTLRGRVLDSELGQPVAGAIVHIGRDAPPLTTDTLGRFVAPSLPAGKTQVSILAIGYDSAAYLVQLPESGTVEGVFPLDFTGYQLPEIVVVAHVEQLAPRYLGFEQRRHLGMGAYLRWDEIRKQGFNSVGDALRTIRGVRIRCDQQTFECRAFMARNPQCEPTWWVDGMEVHSFHENTSIRDVYGIEVYRGAGEVPAEFSGSDAMCGVIVLWTKSRPFR